MGEKFIRGGSDCTRERSPSTPRATDQPPPTAIRARPRTMSEAAMESIFTAAALAVLIILAGAAPGVQAQDEIETANGNSSASPAPVTGNVPIVVYAEGGTVDDFAATVLLGEMHKEGIINFVGDIVENGDSVLPSSIVVAQKFHVLANIIDVPTLLSQTNAYNPFPWGYRTDSLKITTLPEYQEIPCDECTFQDLDNAMDFPNGEDFLKEVLQNAEDGSISYVVTAAMSNIAAVLRENPELESKVKEILWMGGAVNVPGNLLDPTVSSELTIWNDKAEWTCTQTPLRPPISLRTPPSRYSCSRWTYPTRPPSTAPSWIPSMPLSVAWVPPRQRIWTSSCTPCMTRLRRPSPSTGCGTRWLRPTCPQRSKSTTRLPLR